jgi:hypothetical protein
MRGTIARSSLPLGPNEWVRRMRWMIFFGAASLGGIAVVLLALWGMTGFRDLGLGTAGTVAVVLGILATSALGVALMALMFYSDRSNADTEVSRAADDGDANVPGESPSADQLRGDGNPPAGP